MVLVIMGVLILVAGVHFARRSRTAPGGTPLSGEVVHVSEKRSNFSGSRTPLYGPSVAYQDPVTGERRVLPPTSHQSNRYVVGEEVVLIRDPESGEVRLPLPNPRAQMALPFVMGAIFIGLGVLEILD